jgi:hypothetical protein
MLFNPGIGELKIPVYFDSIVIEPDNESKRLSSVFAVLFMEI